MPQEYTWSIHNVPSILLDLDTPAKWQDRVLGAVSFVENHMTYLEAKMPGDGLPDGHYSTYVLDASPPEGGQMWQMHLGSTLNHEDALIEYKWWIYHFAVQLWDPLPGYL